MTEVHLDFSPFSWQFWPLRVQWKPETYPLAPRWRVLKIGPFTVRWGLALDV